MFQTILSRNLPKYVILPGKVKAEKPTLGPEDQQLKVDFQPPP